jgi:hypothetical protein
VKARERERERDELESWRSLEASVLKVLFSNAIFLCEGPFPLFDLGWPLSLSGLLRKQIRR